VSGSFRKTLCQLVAENVGKKVVESTLMHAMEYAWEIVETDAQLCLHSSESLPLKGLNVNGMSMLKVGPG